MGYSVDGSGAGFKRSLLNRSDDVNPSTPRLVPRLRSGWLKNGEPIGSLRAMSSVEWLVELKAPCLRPEPVD